jgi:hypothetical protein
MLILDTEMSKLQASLREEDQVAVMQFSNRADLLQDWTTDGKTIIHALETKLISGKRARFSEGILAAASYFKTAPVGNRHLVIVTDGVENPGGNVSRAEAIAQLMSSNATLHIISYSALGRKDLIRRRRPVRGGGDKTKLPEEWVKTFPKELQLIINAPKIATIDLDLERRRRLKDYQDEMQRAEHVLTGIADETGGQVWLAESVEEMIATGDGVAIDIDSRYVVTYAPKRPFNSSMRGERRIIEVVSRRGGLTLKSRRSYVIVSGR